MSSVEHDRALLRISTKATRAKEAERLAGLAHKVKMREVWQMIYFGMPFRERIGR